jgi:saccharopine dehydrogenase-like NADP-dependent oxidoreductase
MTEVQILGACGQIARVATDLFLARSDARLTLYLRNARRLKKLALGDRVRVVEGDFLVFQKCVGDGVTQEPGGSSR